MVFLSSLLVVCLAIVAQGDDDAPFPAPSKCSLQNTKSASSWESCVKPATAFATCDSDNQPCACSAYTIQQKCYSKYCPGEYPHTSDLEGLCLHPAESTTDPFDNTFFHPSATGTAASKTASSADDDDDNNSSPTATTTPGAATTGAGAGSPSAATETSKPNAGVRVGAGGGLGGGVLAGLVLGLMGFGV